MPLLHDREGHDTSVLRSLHERAVRLLDHVHEADLSTGFIHGDAQRKNAMKTETGAVWIDLEECSIGPFAWDIACLTMHRRFSTSRVLDQYAELSGLDRIPEEIINTLKELRDLEGLTWMMATQHVREQSFQHETQELLTSVLSSINGG